VCGRGFRYTNKDKKLPPDEAPFELLNCPVENTEVVYSSKLGNEQLLAYIITPQRDWTQVLGDDGVEVTTPVDYDEYQVYIRNKVLTYNNKGGVWTRTDAKPLIWNEHIITEYYLNKKRISLIELGKDLFDDINYLESLDKDDMEQFVNAIMVFTNAEVNQSDLAQIRDMGAVSISSTDQKKASVDLLQGRLNATDTQTYYNRLLTALHQILGVPVASDSGTVTSGDTGKAKLTGQGFTSAGIRAEGDETMFGMCDYNSLKVILAVCKDTANSGINTLKASDIDSKFQRDMSDNLLVKTQALQTLYACDIPRKFANSIVNLFGDANAVTKEQENLFGDQVSQQNKGSNTGNTTNEDDKVNEQNNDLTQKLELDNQGQ
jgi:SPP1 family phage portal protein